MTISQPFPQNPQSCDANYQDKFWGDVRELPLTQHRSLPNLEMELMLPELPVPFSETDRVDQVATRSFGASLLQASEETVVCSMEGRFVDQIPSPTMSHQPDQKLINAGIVYQLGDPNVRNPKKAVECFLQACGLEKLEQLSLLGLRFLEENAPSAALVIFLAGAEAGDPACANYLQECCNQGIGFSSSPPMHPITDELVLAKGIVKRASPEIETNANNEATQKVEEQEEASTDASQDSDTSFKARGDRDKDEQEVADTSSQDDPDYKPARPQRRSYSDSSSSDSYESSCSVCQKSHVREKKTGKVLNKLGCDYYYGRNKKEKNFEKAFSYFTLAAKAGNPRAKCNLGYCYLLGKGCKPHKFKGIKLLQEAADAGCTEASNYLAIGRLFSWEEGEIIFKDKHFYFKMIASLFRQGSSSDPVCMQNLGYCYDFGIGVPRNPDKGARLHTIAETMPAKERGDLIKETFYQLTPDVAKGFREADRGRPGPAPSRFLTTKKETPPQDRVCVRLDSSVVGAAQNKLGCDYYYGRDGKEPNAKEAFIHFTLADQARSSLGKANRAYCYLLNEGCEQKSLKSRIYLGGALLKEAADEGCAAAANAVTMGLEFGWDWKNKKFKDLYAYHTKAIEMLQKGSKDPVCMHNLAFFYEYGIGVPCDPEKAEELLAKAKEVSPSEDRRYVIQDLLYQFTLDDARGIWEARLRRRNHYNPSRINRKISANKQSFLKTVEVPSAEYSTTSAAAKDKVENVLENMSKQGNLTPYITALLERAKKGDAEALNDLALRLYEGKDVEQKLSEAFTLFASAAVKCLHCAQSNLARCYQEGIGCEKNENLAMKWWQALSSAGYIPAKNALAHIYMFGCGSDCCKAFDLLQEGEDEGDWLSTRNISLCYALGLGVSFNPIIAKEKRIKAENIQPSKESAHLIKEILTPFSKADVAYPANEKRKESCESSKAEEIHVPPTKRRKIAEDELSGGSSADEDGKPGEE
jgi:TPR repeat protein